MKDTYLLIRKTEDGRASVTASGPSAELAGLAVNGVRYVAGAHPEHTGEMRAMIDRDFRRKTEGLADMVFRFLCALFFCVGVVVVLLAIGYGLHCMGLWALHWLEKTEAAVTAWLVSL